MEDKRYYWLKLNENFFEEDTIEWIEDQENGERYVLFYLKLCVKSLKDNGRLIRYVGDKLIPYDVKALAKLTNTDQDTVAVALKVFEEIGLIEVQDTGELYMKQINEMIGTETDVARRVRKHRAKENLLQSNADETKCNTEIRDKRLDIRDKREEIEPPIPYSEIKDKFNTICKSFSSIKAITDKRKPHVKARYEQLGMDQLEQAFAKLESSSFCKGKNDRGWTATFDWLMQNDTNIIKVLEGKYDNKEDKHGKSNGQANDEIENFDWSKFGC